MIFREEDEDANNSSNGHKSANSSHRGEAPTPTKPFERKNSFLGKLFSKKKSASKPEIGTFSAQFPPPEMVEAYQQLYAPVRKKSQPSDSSKSQRAQSPPVWSPQAQVRNGPSGNFVVYERTGQQQNGNDTYSDNIYNQINNGHVYGQIRSPSQNLYGQVGSPPSSMYGQLSSPPNVTNIYGQAKQSNPTDAASTTGSPQGALQQQYHSSSQESMYSNPPPPLPYRPPPPNPYNGNNRSPRPVPNNVQGNPGSQPQSPAVERQRSNVSSPNKASNSPFPRRNQEVRRELQESPASLYAMSSDPSSSASNSSSGPSSIDSQRSQQLILQQQLQKSPQVQQKALFDDSLVVIEKSNNELEQEMSKTDDSIEDEPVSPPTLTKPVNKNLYRTLPSVLRAPRIDTIHNNRNNLSQEVIYEVEETGSNVNVPILNTHPLARSTSQTIIKDGVANEVESVAPNYPSLSDLSINEVGANFKSLTAQKLMAGLSFNSIDTLIEVNAAAEARNKLNESTETVDFGVI